MEPLIEFIIFYRFGSKYAMVTVNFIIVVASYDAEGRYTYQCVYIIFSHIFLLSFIHCFLG